MRHPSIEQTESLTALLEQVVVFPDGSVTWALLEEAELERALDSPEIIPLVDCEIVPDYQPLAIDRLRLPSPQQPEWLVTAPEFTPVLKSVGR
jgi:hypothetical protein